jgi:Flp pilus assembly protein TadB
MTIVGLIALLSLMSVGGLCLAASGWLPPAPSLTRTMRHLRRPSASLAGGRPGDDRAANRLATTLGRYPSLLPTDVQLRLVGRSRARHAARLSVVVLGGLIVPGLLVEVLQLTGVIGVQWFVPLALSLSCSAVGALAVHTTTIELAATVRTDLRYQLSAYLDVVTMLLAGNTGYEGALEQASRAGDGRLFAEVRRRMREAAARGASLTDALQHTGVDLGLEELEHVAATAALSAAEGAPVARTLAAKCATLRTALATEQESEARLRTSRLTTPIVGMALIFMALVIYPALSFS